MDWMTAKTTKPKCILLDANVIIVAHELKIWTNLIAKCAIVVPSIVVRDEALFYSRGRHGVHEDINLPKLIAAKQISEVAATADEMATLRKTFDRLFAQQMHSGELEALALLKEDRVPHALYCTGDVPAIKALALLDMSDRGISMEKMLGKFGLTKPLKPQFTESFFALHLKRGATDRIQGVGLANKGNLT